MPHTRQTRGRGRAADADPLLQIVQAGQDPAVLPGKPVQEPALPRRHLLGELLAGQAPPSGPPNSA